MGQWGRMIGVAFISSILGWASSLQAGLVGYYPLDGNFLDASGNGNNGIAGSTAPTFGPGLSGGSSDFAAVFSGTNASQLLTLPININTYDQVTLGAWVKPTATDPIRGIFGNDTGGFVREIAIDNRSGTAGYSAYDGAGVFGAGAVGTSAWDFVAVVYNRTGGTDTLYVNGQKFTTTGTPPAGSTFLTVGGDPSVGNPFGGAIDDLFVYNEALSDSQIASIREDGISLATITPLPQAFSMASIVMAGFGVFKVGAGVRRRRARSRSFRKFKSGATIG